MPDYIWGIIGAALGAGVGVALVVMQKMKIAQARGTADQILEAAKSKSNQIVQQAEVKAKEEMYKRKEVFEKERDAQREELRGLEKRLSKREDGLDKKLDLLARKEKRVTDMEDKIAKEEEQIAKKKEDLQQITEKQKSELYRITGMSQDEARDVLLEKVEADIENDISKILAERMDRMKEEADSKAREIITTTIQRVCTDHTADVTVSMVELTSDDMKGRVIGREGRNIRAFEKATGVDVIVDDTPGVIVVSAFDQVRREVAKRSMEKLILDGRIHPARIEEVVKETEKEVEQHIYDMAKSALRECGVHNVHKKIQYLLGRLHYRTSYGQNVLRHSIEVAHLCAAMASEMNVDPVIAKRAGLLHDIGKAIDHEQEGGHPAIGGEWARRYGEKREIIDAIANHHDEMAQETIYSALAQIGDAISASRPGARIENMERYLKRMGQLEEIASGFEGVTQSFAIQAGREVRVLVDSKSVNDENSAKICRDIAKKIEFEMTYPGEVKVTVLRETRVIDYAR